MLYCARVDTLTSQLVSAGLSRSQQVASARLVSLDGEFVQEFFRELLLEWQARR